MELSCGGKSTFASQENAVLPEHSIFWTTRADTIIEGPVALIMCNNCVDGGGGTMGNL